MKTLEQRIAEYENVSGCYGRESVQIKEAFAAGAQSEREELTRWNDPKDLPQSQYEVLAKIDGGYFKIVVFDFSKNLWMVSGTREWINILGWREIHE